MSQEFSRFTRLVAGEVKYIFPKDEDDWLGMEDDFALSFCYDVLWHIAFRLDCTEVLTSLGTFSQYQDKIRNTKAKRAFLQMWIRDLSADRSFEEEFRKLEVVMVAMGTCHASLVELKGTGEYYRLER